MNLNGAPVWIVETKTSSEDISQGSVYWRRLALDQQLSIYIPGAKSLGWNVVGCLYDVLGTVRLQPLMATPMESRKYKKTGELYANQRAVDETPGEFGQRCLAEIVKNPSRYFQRGEIIRLEQEHAESNADIWQTAHAMKESRRLGMYPRNPGSCSNWGRVCEYLPVCCGEASKDDLLLYVKVETEHEELALNPSGKTRITQSALKIYRSCPRKYQLRNVLGIRSRKVAEPLRRGKSVHAAIESLRKTGSLDLAIDSLDKTDAYRFEREKAMLLGYFACWGKPRDIVFVEQQFEMDLINPETGRPSKTFTIAGAIDAGCLANRDFLQPVMLEQLLEQSIAQVGPGLDDNDAAEME